MHFQLPDPIGTGCATSSVMMQLFVLVFEYIFNIKVPQKVAKNLMTRVEPSDYIINYPNTCMHNFYNDQFFSQIFRFPQSFLLSIIPKNNNVVAVSYNFKRPNYTLEHEKFFNSIYMKRNQLEHFTLNEWGDISYKSAKINNLFFPKQEFFVFEEMYLIGKINGFCIGHTGSVLTLFTKTKESLENAENDLFNRINRNNYYTYKWDVK